MKFTFRKMAVLTAMEIIAWEYPAPYEAYNMRNSSLALAKLISGNYWGVFSGEELVGFFCYGNDARLGTKGEHELYRDNNYLDVGLGMHPAYCGRGLGYCFVNAGLKHAREKGWDGGFRLTVASNNLRALKVYQRLGFYKSGEIVWDTNLANVFLVFVLDKFELKQSTFPAD